MSFRLQRSLQAIRSTTPTTTQSFQFPLKKSFTTTPISSSSSSSSSQTPDPNVKLQSRTTKSQNFQKAAEDIGIKMQAAPHSITSSDAAHLKSREARATGQSQPPSDSISAEAQRLAAENEGAVKSSSSPTTDPPVEQSAEDRIKNFESTAQDLAAKIERDPEGVTKEDAGVMHSREQRAFGKTAKGWIASEVQRVAEGNEKGR